MKKIILTFTALILAFSGITQDIQIQYDGYEANVLNIRDLTRLNIVNNLADMPGSILSVRILDRNQKAILQGQSQPFHLKKGMNPSHELKLRLEPMQFAFIHPDYQQYLVGGGMFPPGEYEVCVDLIYRLETYQLTNACRHINVEVLIPPHLIAPYHGEELTEPRPFFVWSPPVIPGNTIPVRYSLKITEIKNGETPELAIRRNQAYFQTGFVPSPIFQYPFAAKAFENDQKYAWTISAHIGNMQLDAPEVWEFNYKPEDKPETEPVKPFFAQTKPYLDDGAIVLIDGKLRFIYTERYQGQELTYRIYNNDHKTHVNCDTDVLPNPKVGENRYTLDVKCKLSETGFYHLEIKTGYGKKYHLKFYFDKDAEYNSGC